MGRAALHDVRITINHANILAPATYFSPIFLTNAAITHTALRGRSFVRRFNLYVNSAVRIHGTNSVVPRIVNIAGRTRSTRPCRVPAIYPSYNTPIIRLRSRTTLHYIGPRYPTRTLHGVVRFTSHSTVSVRNLNATITARLIRGSVIRSTTSVCALAQRRLLALSGFGRGDTSGLLGTVRTSGRGGLSGLLFKFNVHGVNSGTTTLLTRRFNALRTIQRTDTKRVDRVSKFNNMVTRDIMRFFTGRKAASLIRHLTSTKLGVR